MSATYKERTGYDNPSKNPAVKKKKIKTCKKNYGVQNGFMTKQCAENTKKTSWGIKTRIILPDKIIITRSSWETIYALYLFFTGVDFSYEPFKIPYMTDTGKAKLYLPDFVIGNQIVEIKGWVRDEKEIKSKMMGCTEAGYKFVLIDDEKQIEQYKHWLEANTDINLDKILSESKKWTNNPEKFFYTLNLECLPK